MKLFLDWFAKANDKLNPIIVKESRQSIQGRFLFGVVHLFLLLQVVVLVISLSNFQTSRWLGWAYIASKGRELFQVLLGVLLGVCMLFIPFYTGFKIFRDRHDPNGDLLHITTLSPAAMIRGKMLSSLLQTILVYSACLPFLTFAYFLRGTDLFTVFFFLSALFLVIWGSILLFILLASVKTSRFGTGVLFLIGLGASFGLFVLSIAASEEILRKGLSRFFSSWERTQETLGIAMFLLFVIGLLYKLSVAINQPRSSNRSLGTKVYFFFGWLFCSGALLTHSWYYSKKEAMFIWLIFGSMFLWFALLLTIHERGEIHSLRIRKDIPQKHWKRALVFPFFTGSSGGILLMLTLFATMYFIIQMNFNLFKGFGYFSVSDKRGIEIIMGINLLVISYALTTWFIRRRFFPRLRSGYTWVIFLSLVAMALLLPTIGMFFVGFNYANPNEFFAHTPVGFGSSRTREVTSTIGLIWSSVALLFSLFYVARDYRGFRPVKEEPLTQTQASTSTKEETAEEESS